MRRIAIYGKGGIGKSTTSSNVTDALAESGLRVMQIGCDPKADSTRLLTGTDRPVTVLDVMRTKGEAELEDIVREGRNGTLCVECGGPRSPDVQSCEDRRTTVVSGMPDSPQADEYRRLAKALLERSEDVSGGMSLKTQDYGCDCND